MPVISIYNQLIFLRANDEEHGKSSEQTKLASLKYCKTTQDTRAWNWTVIGGYLRDKLMSKMFLKIPCAVWMSNSKFGTKRVKKMGCNNNNKKIIWCKWTPRCSSHPHATITLHCNLLMLLHYNTAYKGGNIKAYYLKLQDLWCQL